MAVQVFFNDVDVTSYVTAISATSISLDCPDLEPGEYDVKIVNENGTSNSVIFTILDVIDPVSDFTYEPYHTERAFNRLLHQYRKPNGR